MRERERERERESERERERETRPFPDASLPRRPGERKRESPRQTRCDVLSSVTGGCSQRRKTSTLKSARWSKTQRMDLCWLRNEHQDYNIYSDVKQLKKLGIQQALVISATGSYQFCTAVESIIRDSHFTVSPARGRRSCRSDKAASQQRG